MLLLGVALIVLILLFGAAAVKGWIAKGLAVAGILLLSVIAFALLGSLITSFLGEDGLMWVLIAATVIAVVWAASSTANKLSERVDGSASGKPRETLEEYRQKLIAARLRREQTDRNENSSD